MNKDDIVDAEFEEIPERDVINITELPEEDIKKIEESENTEPSPEDAAALAKELEEAQKRLEKLNEHILSIPPKMLNKYLRYFYSQLRKNDGLFYSPKTLACFRAGIHRYLPLHRPEINIIEDDIFRQSNRMLTAKVAEFKKSGQQKEKSYDVIQKEDMRKLRSYFEQWLT